jgi:FlaA1/EpsC-like NDP-sugar epimerase
MDRVLDSINPGSVSCGGLQHVPLMEENPSQAIYTNIEEPKILLIYPVCITLRNL